MIKGCNKRVIVMKDTGNGMIEEAFFILKPDASKEAIREEDIMRQANRILERSICGENFSNRSKNSSGKNCSTFFSGALIGAVITAGILLIV